jgi:hypothetical protein
LLERIFQRVVAHASGREGEETEGADELARMVVRILPRNGLALYTNLALPDPVGRTQPD